MSAAHRAAFRGRATGTIIPLAAYVAQPGTEWEALAQIASEPNSFAERWFVGASVRHLAAPADASMVEVRDDDGLVGLLPITTMPRYGRIPIRHAENWLHYNCFLGTPLVRQGQEAVFWTCLLEALDRNAALPAFLHVVGLRGDGPLVAALLGVRSGAAIVHRSTRALLQSDLGPTAYYEATVRKKKRKEIGRLQSRLRELGTIEAHQFGPDDDLDTWVDAFLTLEASGWKGRDGAALANDQATEAFLRDALRGAAEAGRLDMLRIDLDGQPIAMLVNFIALPGSFSFKIAFDENHGRFSPGVLIQLENLKILERPGFDWMDSCASEDHPMINSLWGERCEIVRISVPLRGWRRRMMFSGARALENGSAMVRRWR